MRIKIGHKPSICEYSDRWGMAMGEYHVNRPYWLDEEFWEDINGFQLFQPIQTSKVPECQSDVLKNPEEYVSNYKEMQYWLKKSHYMTWEFNAFESKEDTTVGVRHFAMFGEPRLVRWNWGHSIRRFSLRVAVPFINWYSRTFGENKKYVKWQREQHKERANEETDAKKLKKVLKQVEEKHGVKKQKRSTDVKDKG